MTRMKLGVAHELGLAVAASAAIAIVLFGGELPAFAWLVMGAPWLSCAMGLKRKSAPALSATLLGFASIALGVVVLVRGGVESSVLAGAELLLGLLTARLLVRKTPSHDLQALAITLLLVLAGSALNVGLNYLVWFIIYAVAVVWALTTRQLLAGASSSSPSPSPSLPVPADASPARSRAPTAAPAAAPTAAPTAPTTAAAPSSSDALRARARTDVVTPAFFGATAAISLAVLCTSALVFTTFPRVGLGEIGSFLVKDSKLPKSVGLRGDPRALGGTAPVARLRRVPREAFDTGLYLRGAVYDVITLEGFAQSPQQQPERFRADGRMFLADAPVETRYEVTLMPLVGDTLLSLGGVVAMRALGGGAANPNLSLGIAGRTRSDELKAYSALVSPMRYEVSGGIARPGWIPPPGDIVDFDGSTRSRRKPRPLTDDARYKWTALPGGFDKELAAVSEGVVARLPTDASVELKAQALREFMLESFRYSQDPPRFANAPLRAFLLEDRQGHCEFFAAAYALLLRQQQIPARVVGGFQGGAWDDGVIVFQEGHAHAWVEWWHDEHGWIVDDATPLAAAPRLELSGIAAIIDRARRLWDDRVVDYSLQDQTDALTAARKALAAAPGVALFVLGLTLPVLVVAGVVLARRAHRRGSARGHPLAEALVDAVARVNGAPVSPALTVREAVDAVAVDDAALRQACAAALDAYERERFAGAAVDAGARKRLVDDVKRAAARASAAGGR